jgi:hypothetical protein
MKTVCCSRDEEYYIDGNERYQNCMLLSGWRNNIILMVMEKIESGYA